MADDDTQKASPQDIQAALEKQVAQLKLEIGRINKTLADRAEEAAETAEGWYETASDKAAQASRQLKAQAQTVSETIRDNRGTVSASLLAGGVIGFLIGLACSRPDSHHQRWW